MPRGGFRRLEKELIMIQDADKSPSVTQAAIIHVLQLFIEDNASVAKRERKILNKIIITIQDDLFGKALASGVRLKAWLLTS